METILRSPSRTVTIGPAQPFCVIGERINPTGRKAFQAQLQAGDLSQIEIDVAQQVAGGADMLDVNVGDPLADEVGLMAQAIPLVQGLCDLPLCIDSSVIEALEAGLAAYDGKALVNSVTGEDARLEAILPIVARHGAAVIGLANDEDIPMEPERRLEVAKKIVAAAGDHGIPPEDVIIDPLAMPVGAEPRAVTLFIETLHLLRDELGVNTTCGAGNTSFGLPGRHTLGAAFLAVAQSHGLTSAIMDSRRDEMVEAVRATDFLLGRDEWGAAWIRRYREKQAAAARERRRGSPGAAGAGSRPAPLPPDGGGSRRQGGARARRDDGVRRGQLERRRHRLDLRRPRHLQEVQGADRLRARVAQPGRSARVLRRGAEGGLAARVPRARAGGPDRRGAAAADAAEGGARRESGAT